MDQVPGGLGSAWPGSRSRSELGRRPGGLGARGRAGVPAAASGDHERAQGPGRCGSSPATTGRNGSRGTEETAERRRRRLPQRIRRRGGSRRPLAPGVCRRLPRGRGGQTGLGAGVAWPEPGRAGGRSPCPAYGETCPGTDGTRVPGLGPRERRAGDGAGRVLAWLHLRLRPARCPGRRLLFPSSRSLTVGQGSLTLSACAVILIPES